MISEINTFEEYINLLQELGVDYSVYTQDSYQYTDLQYQFYCALCKVEQPNNITKCAEKLVSTDPNKFSTFGRIGLFNWVSLTSYFPTSLYKSLGEEKRCCNNQYDRIIKNGGYSLGVLLNRAINNSLLFSALVRNPVILNTKDITAYYEHGLRAMQHHLENFFQIPHFDLASLQEGEISFNQNFVRYTNVIVPYVAAYKDTLEEFNGFAKLLMECGADSVIGVFLTRYKPSIDGREINNFDERILEFPIIQENPFITMLG